MPLLNRKVDYALVILCYLHHKTEGGCAREIASRFGLSRAFVANILKDLCQRNYVASHRGVKGGYVLKPQAADQTLANLIDALDETVQLAECNAVPPEGCCNLLETCPIRVPIGDVHRRIREVLESVKLGELFQQSTIDLPLQLDLSRCEKQHA
jgi:Rrf2 family protein